LKTIGNFESATEAKRKIVQVLDVVAERLGNTRTVCKKYYVHPLILSLYENNSLEKYYNKLEEIEQEDGIPSLTQEEKVLMKILETG
jgi:DNA topoisomerase-1